MSDFDQQVTDGVASGKITTEDAAILHTYRDFLAELHLRKTDRQAWREKWAAYAGGLADGPTTRDEFERIRAERAAERAAQ